MSNRMFKRLSGMPTDAVARINQTLPDQNAPAAEIPFTFAQQSIIQPFGSTITDMSFAILPQPVNQPIVPSTLQTKQNTGYAIALTPDAECPVAVIFKAGGTRLTSTPIRLLPGQIIRPHGLPRTSDAESGSFSGFDFGLPFGWLGGGIGRLIVFKTEDSMLRYIGGGGNTVLFHTESFIPLAADVTTTLPNWPRSFPWLNAQSQLDTTATVTAAALAQGAPAQISVRPTKVILELTCNAAGLAAAETVDVYVHREGNAIPIHDYVTFPITPAGSNSFVQIDGQLLNAVADPACYVNFVSGTAAVRGYTINAYRYGVLS